MGKQIYVWMQGLPGLILDYFYNEQRQVDNFYTEYRVRQGANAINSGLGKKYFRLILGCVQLLGPWYVSTLISAWISN